MLALSPVLAERRAQAVLRRLGPGPARGVEVGVASGSMSAALLRGKADLALVMVDSWLPADRQPTAYVDSGDPCAGLLPWQQERNKHLAHAVTAFAMDRRTVWARDSREVARYYPKQTFDFVFLDAAHDLDSVRADLTAWARCVRPDGWLCGHDYTPAFPGVTQAVDAWVVAHGGRVECDENDTWFVRQGTAI